MDASVAWYRAQLRRALARRLAAEVIFVALLAGSAYVVIRPAISPAVLTAGVVAACAVRVAVASYTNPLDRRSLRRYLTNALDCVPVALDGTVAPAASPLVDAGYSPVAAAGQHGDATVHYDLLSPANQLVLAAVARASGSVMLLSTLRDGRVVVSSTLQVPPGDRLVSNTVPGASASELHRSHWAVLRRLVGSPIDLVPVPLGAFVAVLAEERAAHRTLGPLAAYLDLTCRGRSSRFVVTIPPEAVLARGLASAARAERAPARGYESLATLASRP